MRMYSGENKRSIVIEMDRKDVEKYIGKEQAENLTDKQLEEIVYQVGTLMECDLIDGDRIDYYVDAVMMGWKEEEA